MFLEGKSEPALLGEWLDMNLCACFLFDGLDEARCGHVRGIVSPVAMAAGHYIFQEGEPAGRLYLIEEGQVELTTRLNGPFELPVAMLKSQADCFGTSSLLPPFIYSISAKCAAAGSLYAIERTELFALIDKDPQLGYLIMKNLSQHLLSRLREVRQELKIHFRNLYKSVH